MEDKVSVSTVVRSIMLFIAVFNAICHLAGWTPVEVDETAIYEAVSAVFLLATTVAAWWKNNSFTKAAIQADKLMKELKQEK